MKVRAVMVGAVVLGASALALTVGQAAQEGDKAPTTLKATVVSAPAAGQTVHPQKTETATTGQSKTNIVTGSYIPTKVQKAGRITDGMYDVTIIDRGDIDSSGASSVAGVLAREPGIRIRSH